MKIAILFAAGVSGMTARTLEWRPS